MDKPVYEGTSGRTLPSVAKEGIPSGPIGPFTPPDDTISKEVGVIQRTLFIIRGLPGTGKTTLARELAGNIVCEADQYFMENGEYHFDPTRLSLAHLYCQNRVQHFMATKYSSIAVSNTFTRRWEMQVYYELAAFFGYRVVEITMSGICFGNIHKVPEETIAKMRERWEQ